MRHQMKTGYGAVIMIQHVSRRNSKFSFVQSEALIAFNYCALKALQLLTAEPTLRRSLRLQTGEPHHLRPLVGLVGDQPAEIRRRAADDHAAELVEARLDLRVGEHRIGLAVEPVDRRRGRALRRGEAGPG